MRSGVAPPACPARTRPPGRRATVRAGTPREALHGHAVIWKDCRRPWWAIVGAPLRRAELRRLVSHRSLPAWRRSLPSARFRPFVAPAPFLLGRTSAAQEMCRATREVSCPAPAWAACRAVEQGALHRAQAAPQAQAGTGHPSPSPARGTAPRPGHVGLGHRQQAPRLRSGQAEGRPARGERHRPPPRDHHPAENEEAGPVRIDGADPRQPARLAHPPRRIAR